MKKNEITALQDSDFIRRLKNYDHKNHIERAAEAFSDTFPNANSAIFTDDFEKIVITLCNFFDKNKN